MSAVWHSVQAPSAVVMVRPHRFCPNPATAGDNAFQRPMSGTGAEAALAAYEEVSAAAKRLEAEGIRVHLFEDEGYDTPDSVFPNNWFSTHPGGLVAVYPMYAANRRRERRQDVLDMLKSRYRVQNVIDYSGLESDGLFLEGTGAMVIDHVANVAYTARSNRAHIVALERFCAHFGFEPMAFDTADDDGNPIYHTNVLMCIATHYALAGLSLIRDRERANMVKTRLVQSGREVIELSNEQIKQFAGNALELSGAGGSMLVMSQRGVDSLHQEQRLAIGRHSRIVGLNIPTVELAGGSARCMIAGIHLSPRQG